MSRTYVAVVLRLSNDAFAVHTTNRRQKRCPTFCLSAEALVAAFLQQQVGHWLLAARRYLFFSLFMIA